MRRLMQRSCCCFAQSCKRDSVVDDMAAFVRSANFTEAAHERNIEAGVLVRDAGFARSLSGQFDRFVAQSRFVRLQVA